MSIQRRDPGRVAVDEVDEKVQGNEQTEQRRSPRALCDIPVEYELKGARSRDGRMTDIGMAGALLETPEEIPVGTHLVLRFHLPLSNRPIQTVGRVTWSRQRNVGVGFVGLNLWDQEEIWKYYARETARHRHPGT